MNIEYHLLRWRKWCSVGTGAPKHPTCLVGKMIKSPPDADVYVPLSDEEAERVNTALQILKMRYPKPYEAVMVRYKDGVFDDKRAANRLKCSPETVRQRRSQGHTFLDGALNV